MGAVNARMILAPYGASDCSVRRDEKTVLVDLGFMVT